MEAKESACNASLASRPAQAAASSAYKAGRRPKTSLQPMAPQASSSPRPKQLNCKYGDQFIDFPECPSGGFNARAYKECRNCFLDKKKGDRKAKMTGKTAVALADNSSFKSTGSSSRSSPPPPASCVSNTTTTQTNATLKGQRQIPGDHPRLDVVFTLSTTAAFIEMRMDGAVADSVAQLTIIPASRLCAGKINLCDVKAPEVDLTAANRAKMDVIGILNAHINLYFQGDSSAQRRKCTWSAT